MNPIDDGILNAILNINPNGELSASESQLIEFKQVFNWSDKKAKAKYAKSIASFANNKGGYLFFGIEDGTKRILGIDNSESVDNASITSFLNSYFQPAIVYHRKSFVIGSKTIEVL